MEELAGDAEVAAGVVGIPHPYPTGAALGWIEALNRDDRAEITWAMRTKEEGILVGCATLFLVQKHRRAEIAFWVGRPIGGVASPQRQRWPLLIMPSISWRSTASMAAIFRGMRLREQYWRN